MFRHHRCVHGVENVSAIDRDDEHRLGPGRTACFFQRQEMLLLSLEMMGPGLHRGRACHGRRGAFVCVLTDRAHSLTCQSIHLPGPLFQGRPWPARHHVALHSGPQGSGGPDYCHGVICDDDGGDAHYAEMGIHPRSRETLEPGPGHEAHLLICGDHEGHLLSA